MNIMLIRRSLVAKRRRRWDGREEGRGGGKRPDSLPRI